MWLNNMEEIGKCFICKEDILESEAYEEVSIDRRKVLVHNKQGCTEIIREIKLTKNHLRCHVCNKKTDNMIFIAGSFIFVCRGECEKNLGNEVLGRSR